MNSGCICMTSSRYATSLTGAQLTARGVIDMELRVFAEETEDFEFANQDEERNALAERLARVLFPEPEGYDFGGPT